MFAELTWRQKLLLAVVFVVFVLYVVALLWCITPRGDGPVVTSKAGFYFMQRDLVKPKPPQP